MSATVSIVLIAWMNGDTSHTALTMGVTKDSFPINFNRVFFIELSTSTDPDKLNLCLAEYRADRGDYFWLNMEKYSSHGSSFPCLVNTY